MPTVASLNPVRSSFITDDPETTLIDFRADYKDGYNPLSEAHKIAGQVIKFLDAHCATKRNETIDHEPTDRIQNSGILLRG